MEINDIEWEITCNRMTAARVFTLMKQHVTVFDLASELERLAALGYAPMVLYDDDGNWAISDEGYSSVRKDENDDFSCSSHGEAAWFRDTPQAAWECYLERLRENGNEV